MVDVISITALVISVVALVTTVLQVLQQYYGSAEGYRRCAKSVMGKWHQGTVRSSATFLRIHDDFPWLRYFFPINVNSVEAVFSDKLQIYSNENSIAKNFASKSYSRRQLCFVRKLQTGTVLFLEDQFII